MPAPRIKPSSNEKSLLHCSEPKTSACRHKRGLYVGTQLGGGQVYIRDRESGVGGREKET